jgi:hypothetical protein
LTPCRHAARAGSRESKRRIAPCSTEGLARGHINGVTQEIFDLRATTPDASGTRMLLRDDELAH